MLHTLFAREHNYLCDQLASKHPTWTDEQLYETAKLINSAIIAKIHTIEWTPAILPNPITKLAMHVNWSGVVDEDLRRSSSSSARTSSSAASSDRTPSSSARRTR